MLVSTVEKQQSREAGANEEGKERSDFVILKKVDKTELKKMLFLRSQQLSSSDYGGKAFHGEQRQCKGPGAESHRGRLSSSKGAMCVGEEAFQKVTGSQVMWVHIS